MTFQIQQPNPLGAFLQARAGVQGIQAQQQQMADNREIMGMRREQHQSNQRTADMEQEAIFWNGVGQAADYIMSDPAQAPARLAEVQNRYRPILGDRVDAITLDQIPGLRAQITSELNQQMPANVRTHQYFRGLPEDQQAEFLNLQRSGNVVMIGEVPHYRNQDGSLTPLSTLQTETTGARAIAQAKTEGQVETGYQRNEQGVVGPQQGAPLSPQMEDRLVEFTAAAQEARANAANYTQLADEMVARMPQSGIAARWADAYRELTGTENAESLLRRRWAELRVGNAIQNLPPGVASDKDIELVMSAFLPTFAEPETVASFLRGLAKVEEIEAEYQAFRAEYISNNGTARGMDAAWREQIEAQSGGQSGGSQGDNDPLGLRGR